MKLKRGLFISFISIILLTELNALDKGFRLSIEPVYTLRNGTLFEYVYEKDSSGTVYKMSELDWPVENISYLGARLDGGWKIIELNTEFTAAIPNKSSKMTDYDWLNQRNHDMCTNKSLTDNRVKSGFDFEVNAGVRFNPVSTLYLFPSIGYSYSDIKFYSANGELWYGTPEWTKLSYYVSHEDSRAHNEKIDEKSAISYDREIYNFQMSLDISYVFFDKLTVGTFVTTMPYTYVKSVDHHYSSDTYFLDIIKSNFKQWDFGASVEYNIWKGLIATTRFDYNILLFEKGINYENKGSSRFFKNSKTTVISGCEGNWWNLQFGLKWAF